MPPDPAHRRSSGAHTHRTRVRSRRIRTVVMFAVLIILGVLLGVYTSDSSAPKLSSASSSSKKGTVATHRTNGIAAAESGLLPWTLAAPISRAVVLPGRSQLAILGGLTASNTSAQGVYTLDTTNGKLAHVANLTGGLHDSSGAVIDGQDVTFGGGSPATVATVQAVPPPAQADLGRS